MSEVKDLLNGVKGSTITREALEKLMQIIFDTMEAQKVTVTDNIPIDVESEDDLDTVIASQVPTVLAVYKAIKKINHVYLRFVKSVDGKSFKEMMEDATPEEMCFYIFKDSATDNNFDLYFYDSQQGDYVNIGSTMFDISSLKLDGYWSKEELKVEDMLEQFKEAVDVTDVLKGYWSKDEFDPSEYLKKDDIDVVTPDDVQSMWDAIVNAAESN